MKFKDAIDSEVPKDDSTSMGEKMLLYWLIRELKPKVVIETGTHRGLTSLYMAHALFDNGEGHLTTCDPNPEWYAKGNFAKFPELSPFITFKLCKGKDLEVENIDFAFIDGFHEFTDVLEELHMLLPRMSETSVAVFHDCWFGNSDGVNEALKESGIDTLWLGTKNAIRLFSKHPPRPTGL
jgi:predicted O-methyltransferase YrrM